MIPLDEPAAPVPSLGAQDAEVVVVLGTASGAEAPELARYLVAERLAACVNLLPGARSIYRWQDEVCDEQETLLVMKTTRAALDELKHRYVERHSHDVPEFLVLSTAGGHAAYLDWVQREVGALQRRSAKEPS